MDIHQLHKVQTDQRVWSIDWHPTSNILASVGSGKTITLWSLKEGTLEKVSTILTDHSKTIRCVKFSHKGDKIAIGSFDASISVWVYNGESSDYEHISTLEGHEHEVKSLTWSPDDDKLASCSRDKNIWIWEFDPISYDYVCDCVLEGHTQDVKYLSWFPDSTKIVSCSYDNTIRIWDHDDDDYVCKQVIQAHKSIVWCVEIDHPYLFSCCQDGTVSQWKQNTENGLYELFWIYEGLHTLPVYTLAIVGQYILSAGADNWIYMYRKHNQADTQTEDKGKSMKPQVVAKVMHESDVNCIKVKKNAEGICLLASCSDDETVRIWKINGI